MTWPGIPSGRGNTCAEEGCGNTRRPKGNDCRACYKQKWKRHKRASTIDEHSWAKDVTEVPLTRHSRREMDGLAYREWQRRSDEYS